MQENGLEYRELLTEANFLEDLAIMVQRGGIDFDIVNKSLGASIPYRWSLWKPTAYWLRDEITKDRTTFKEFEGLAKKIARTNSDAVKVDLDGNIVWEGFRD